MMQQTAIAQPSIAPRKGPGSKSARREAARTQDVESNEVITVENTASMQTRLEDMLAVWNQRARPDLVSIYGRTRIPEGTFQASIGIGHLVIDIPSAFDKSRRHQMSARVDSFYRRQARSHLHSKTELHVTPLSG